MSTRRYLNNRVATSSMLLPVAIVASILWWIYPDFPDIREGLGFGVCMACTALMVELNNANVLLRVRSRMVSALFVLIWSACTFLHVIQWGHLVALCLILAYHSLFRAYQKESSTADVFNAFFCIGLGALMVPQLLLLSIPFAMAFFGFQAMNIHAFFAMLLGLFSPAWLGGGVVFLTDSFPEVSSHFTRVIHWSLDQYRTITLSQIGIVLWLMVLNGISIVYTLQNSFQDKIRTRVLYYFMVWMSFVYFGLLLMFPQHFNTFLLLYLMNSCPLIAHYFALANNKVSQILFLLATLSFVMILTVHWWLPLLWEQLN